MSKIRKGFTLIEMAVVLVLLAILAALAVPTFNALMNAAAEATAQRTVEAIVNDAEGISAIDGTIYPLSQADLDAAVGDVTGADVTPLLADETAVVTVPTQRGTFAFTVDLGNGSITAGPEVSEDD